MELNSLLNESAAGFKSLQADAARLADKWSATGLLEGLGNDIDKNNMSVILENQAKQIIKEMNSTGTGALGTATGNAEQWAGVALPLVRKVFAQIAAKDFVSVQPMNLPSGLVFYLDFKYGTTKTPFSSGDSMYGVLDQKDTDANGGLYGVGRYGYSINNTSSVATSVATASVSLAQLTVVQLVTTCTATYRLLTTKCL